MSIHKLQEKTEYILKNVYGDKINSPYICNELRYREVNTTVVYPENLAYMYDHEPQYAPKKYCELFLDNQTATIREPSEILVSARFPRVVVDIIPKLTNPVSEKVTSWGIEFNGIGTPWLWITGGTGAGKTCNAAIATILAAQKVDEAKGKAINFVFVTARDMTEIVDGSGNYSGRDSKLTKHEVRRQWLNADLLIVDDLGLERHTSTSWDTISRVLDGRQSEKLPTVITCPYSGASWVKKYNREDPHETYRLASRIADALSGWTHSKSNVKAHVIDLEASNQRLTFDGY